MNSIKKIQSLPEKRKKIILWLALVVIGIFLLYWWGKNFQDKLKDFKAENNQEGLEFPSLELPSLGEEIKKIPCLEFLNNQ